MPHLLRAELHTVSGHIPLSKDSKKAQITLSLLLLHSLFFAYIGHSGLSQKSESVSATGSSTSEHLTDFALSTVSISARVITSAYSSSLPPG